MQWDIVIGLEVHVQLLTQSKIFSASPNQFGAEPNEHASLIDLGFPGTLPVLNRAAVEQAIKFGVAVGAKIHPLSVFERKNYFYPDLPKGYQTSQFEAPIVIGGEINAPLDSNADNTVQLTRAHLEEDAGKSTHRSNDSGIDLNRAGTPLLEIVTEPCIHSVEEALSYLRNLHQLVQYLEICDGNMQEGSFRCDINLSLKPKGSDKLGTRTEIKNMNSFRFIEKAMIYEIDRHMDVLESGGEIIQETRLFNDKTEQTQSMRSKEEANDYRYFPCPDLLPVAIEPSLIDEIRANLPELPLAKFHRYQQQYQLSADDAKRLTSDKNIAAFYEATLASTEASAKTIANWLLVELIGYLNKQEIAIQHSPISSDGFAELLTAIHNDTISGKTGKYVLKKMCDEQATAKDIIDKENLAQVADSGELEAIIQSIIEANPKQVEQFQSGKDKVFGFFVGQVMKQTQGQANPKLVNSLLQTALKK